MYAMPRLQRQFIREVAFICLSIRRTLEQLLTLQCGTPVKCAALRSERALQGNASINACSVRKERKDGEGKILSKNLSRYPPKLNAWLASVVVQTLEGSVKFGRGPACGERRAGAAPLVSSWSRIARKNVSAGLLNELVVSGEDFFLGAASRAAYVHVDDVFSCDGDFSGISASPAKRAMVVTAEATGQVVKL